MTDVSKGRLAADNRELRKILKEFADIHPSNQDAINELQMRVNHLLDEQDRRRGAIPEGKRQRQKLAAAASSAAMAEKRAELEPMVQKLWGDGMSLRQIAATLNERGIKTPRGKDWSAGTVSNLLPELCKGQLDSLPGHNPEP
jgi:hypothetical protein